MFVHITVAGPEFYYSGVEIKEAELVSKKTSGSRKRRYSNHSGARRV